MHFNGNGHARIISATTFVITSLNVRVAFGCKVAAKLPRIMPSLYVALLSRQMQWTIPLLDKLELGNFISTTGKSILNLVKL